jgi:hypothetical protein
MPDLRDTPPADDIGADTQSRFGFQHHCIAKRALRLLTGTQVRQLVCEWHEDYLVIPSTGPQEIVSVKHLDPSQARWTISGLWRDGGMEHLFNRWRDSGESVRCRLETNAGMRTGTGEPGELMAACAAGDDGELEEWAHKIPKVVAGPVDPIELERFLRVFRIDNSFPSRDHIRDVNIEQTIRPTLEYLGWTAIGARSAYRAILDEVRDACSDYADRLNALAVQADPLSLNGDAVMQARVQRRTLDEARLVGAIRQRFYRSPTLLVPESTTRDASVLVKKLRKGAVGPSGVENAKRLRSAWLLYRKNWQDDLTDSDPQIEDLRSQLLQIAADAEAVSIPLGTPYGQRMMTEIQKRLANGALPRPPQRAADAGHLLGLVFDLTQDCHVWWSPEFDVDEAS